MVHWKSISDIRRDYGQLSLNEDDIDPCPIVQFERWFAEVVESEKNDPTTMLLSTVDEKGHPDSRCVLLKEIFDGQFVFYTNYQSVKAKQMEANPSVALNFYWPNMARQVRIRGQVKKTSQEKSDAYFLSRPLANQLGSIASPQSTEISGRIELEKKFNELVIKHQKEPVVRPVHWGGFAVTPEQIEFWQGRDSRLSDRIQYQLQHGKWHHRRLAP